VVHENIEEGHQRVENTALDSLPVQAAHEFRLDVADASEIVIDKSYFNAFRNLPKEYFFNAMKGLGILHGKIFHKNKFPGVSQILQKGFQGGFRLRIVRDIGILVNRVAAGGLDIVFLIVDIDIILLQGAQHVLIL